MRCSSDVLKKTLPLDVFGDVSEKVKHLTNDTSNDVSPSALTGVRKIGVGMDPQRSEWAKNHLPPSTIRVMCLDWIHDQEKTLDLTA